jgi:hypothetical protein
MIAPTGFILYDFAASCWRPPVPWRMPEALAESAALARQQDPSRHIRAPRLTRKVVTAAASGRAQAVRGGCHVSRGGHGTRRSIAANRSHLPPKPRDMSPGAQRPLVRCCRPASAYWHRRAAATISSTEGILPIPAGPSVAHSTCAQRTMPSRSIRNWPLSCGH